jgi:hypothetical protein
MPKGKESCFAELRRLRARFHNISQQFHGSEDPFLPSNQYYEMHE